MNRRHALAATAALTACARGHSQPAPYAAGGGPDLLTRQLTPRIGKALGQTVFVDNKVGAGGSSRPNSCRSSRPTATPGCSAPRPT